MVDGAAVADVDLFSPTRSRLDFGFFQPSPAASGSEPAHWLSGEQRRVVKQPTFGDASVVSFADVLTGGEPEAEFPEGVDVLERLSQAVRSVLDEIEATLQENRQEGILHGEICANQTAVATCKRMALLIIDRLLAPPRGLKWGAFGEDGGGVSLVLQSLISDRRVDFRISPDGACLTAIRIDENMRSESVVLSVTDRDALRERAGWVNQRA